MLLINGDNPCWFLQRPDRMKIVVDERQQLFARSASFLQFRDEVALALLFGLLDQHLGVSNDQIERRTQVVDQTRWQWMPHRFTIRKLRVSHNVGFPTAAISSPLSSASILASKRGSSTGLVS